jgi:hypothetical protein
MRQREGDADPLLAQLKAVLYQDNESFKLVDKYKHT